MSYLQSSHKYIVARVPSVIPKTVPFNRWEQASIQGGGYTDFDTLSVSGLNILSATSNTGGAGIIMYGTNDQFFLGNNFTIHITISDFVLNSGVAPTLQAFDQFGSPLILYTGVISNGNIDVYVTPTNQGMMIRLSNLTGNTTDFSANFIVTATEDGGIAYKYVTKN